MLAVFTYLQLDGALYNHRLDFVTGDRFMVKAPAQCPLATATILRKVHDRKRIIICFYSLSVILIFHMKALDFSKEKKDFLCSISEASMSHDYTSA
jgi:hypothetical protein